MGLLFIILDAVVPQALKKTELFVRGSFKQQGRHQQHTNTERKYAYESQELPSFCDKGGELAPKHTSIESF